ncbi:MAG: N-acetyl-gamma-glutamyl-phosphate reductase [Streptosporangiales bacterium]|nr:N-acetyl-gamma-glutamyl-phosphate reductase [Streptosporangiales bacterium]
MAWRVAVAGASGYAGGELLRLLLAHSQFEVGAVTAAGNAGTRLGEHHPQLTGLTDRMLTETTVEQLAGHDVVFLALPHGHSAAIAATLPESTLVVDCAADHRLRDPAAWQRWYGGEHYGSWPYGLPELPAAREKLAGARRVAVPGCYPTAVLLALVPAFAAGVVEPEAVIVAASGTSGAGRAMKPHLLGSEVMGAMSPYGVGGGHRHTPEIIQGLGDAAGAPVRVSFTPTLAPMPRGELVTCSAKLPDPAAPVRQVYEQAYADEPFVHLLPDGQWPTTAATLGANTAHVQVTVDQDAERLIAICALDNLTKGTAGQAIQCANLALGLPEITGLPMAGVAP